MEKIIVNKIRCEKCGDVIESTNVTISNFANVVRLLSMADTIIYGVVEMWKTGKN